MWVEPILFILIIVGGTAGELCIARAMRIVGEVTDFRPLAIIRVILRALRVGWMWLGVALMATAFFALLGELSIENVSFVVPVTALNYVVGALGGKAFLGERVSRERWAGVALVCVGVMLVLIGKSGR
jgi:drug/metabolite transporter (DMT)-like permease